MKLEKPSGVSGCIGGALRLVLGVTLGGGIGIIAGAMWAVSTGFADPGGGAQGLGLLIGGLGGGVLGAVLGGVLGTVLGAFAGSRNVAAAEPEEPPPVMPIEGE